MIPTTLTRTLTAALTASTLALVAAPPAQACTSFRVQSQDGAWLAARSMEFEMDLRSQVMLVPRGHHLTATRPDDFKPGLAWTAKHGFLGINALGLDIAADGLNEVGLAVGALFLPGFAEYQPFPADGKHAVSNVELANYLLSNFATVAEVREALPRLTVYNLILPQAGPLPMHWTIMDPQGDAIVVEYLEGKLHIHDNPIGVMTNSPSFDWHLTNLRNYIGMTTLNASPLKLGTVEIKPLGQGGGLKGLPGDYSPPSRFVKTTALTYAAVPVATAAEGTNLAFHILNAVDIPVGAVVAEPPAKSGDTPLSDYDKTEWARVYDLKNRFAYFRTYGDLNLRKVDLRKVDFGGKQIQHIPMPTTLEAQDVTPTASK